MLPKDQFVQVSDAEHLTICRIKSSVCSSRGGGGLGLGTPLHEQYRCGVKG